MQAPPIETRFRARILIGSNPAKGCGIRDDSMAGKVRRRLA